ncbi:MAG: hypothetical protein Q8J78_04390 [Moraxellaceae bacterium]|nr:hypothetical protein [Moraxellaceae bacterium]
MTEFLAENARLRQLSRRYADGHLGVEDFRAARRAIIEALEAGRTESLPAEDTTTPAATPTSAFDATDVRLPDDSAVFYKTMPPHVPAEPDEPAAESAGWDDSTQVLAIVLVVALLIAIGALVYVFVL